MLLYAYNWLQLQNQKNKKYRIKTSKLCCSDASNQWTTCKIILRFKSIKRRRTLLQWLCLSSVLLTGLVPTNMHPPIQSTTLLQNNALRAASELQDVVRDMLQPGPLSHSFLVFRVTLITHCAKVVYAITRFCLNIVRKFKCSGKSEACTVM